MAQRNSCSQSWTAFTTICAELADLGYAAALLDWDQETVMPPRAGAARANQSATINGLAHQKLTAPSVGRLLDRLDAEAANQPDEFGVVERAQIRELRRDYERAVKLPTRLVQDLTRATSHGFEVWRQARAEDRWVLFEPALQRTIELKREEAQRLGFAGSPYDALLDIYEPSLTTATLTPIFAELRQALVPLIAEIVEAPRRSPAPAKSAEGEFEIGKQWQFAADVIRAIGFDFEAGRLDQAPHPFATKVGFGDVRLTDRTDAHDLRVILFGVIHEGGHGLYEQGLPAEIERTSIGKAVSLGIHESQSRLWENFIGRSAPFWQYFLPRARETFPERLGNADIESFVGAVNVVEPSLIRVEADELTYNLHILVRFELERGLLEGTINVHDLPELWNATMQSYLGLTPTTNRDGVLQDIHWASGLIGYFPTYTLGNIYAAQLWSTLRAQQPDLDAQIAAGEFGPIRSWLQEHVYQHGSIYQPIELIERATGAPPTSQHLIDYLQSKYRALYGLPAPAG